MVNWRRLEEMRKEKGDQRFAVAMVNLINEGRLTPAEFSVRGLWEACGRPNIVGDRVIPTGRVLEADLKGLMEAGMESSAFPTVVGALINKVVQDAYTLEPGITDQLVTEIPSSQKDDVIVGFTAMDGVKEVGEAMDYEEAGFAEKYHKIENRKFGRLIGVTAEMVKFDQTGQIVQRAAALGQMARQKWEEIGMNAICEKTYSGKQASWRPGGTSTQLYSDTSADPYSAATCDNVNTNTLADESDVKENLILLGAMVDEKGNPIVVNPTHLVAGPGYIGIAKKIAASGATVVASYSAGVMNPYQNTFTPLMSPWIVSILGANYWLIGEFKKQFVRTVVFPLQVFQAAPGNDDEWKRDVVYGWKVRFMAGVGAISNKYVIRSTGAS
jgi:hypothetical protein